MCHQEARRSDGARVGTETDPSDVVQPGHIYTANEQVAMASMTKAARDAHSRRIPIGRMGTGEDIGNVVAFLCSSAASYITGTTISVDGGYTVSLDLQTVGITSAAE